MAWLSGWAKRVKFTTDHTDVDSTLTDFPVLLHLGTSIGRANDDVSFIFDELTADANRKKIAVQDDGTGNECYVEIEEWTDADEEAWLWSKVPTVHADSDDDLYLYYDSSHADNTTYVGDTNSVVAESVWDSNYVFVCHMHDDPDTSHVRDSTQYDNDGTKVGAGTPAVSTSGKISDCQDFEKTGGPAYFDCGDTVSLDITGDKVSIESWVNAESIEAAKWNNIGPKWEYTAGAFAAYALGFRNTKVEFLINADASTRLEYNFAPNTATWYHYCGVYDGSNMYIYWNGAQAATVGQTGNINSGQNFIVGTNDGGNNADGWDGLIDEFRVSDTNRSAAWLKASYETGRDDLLDWGSEESAPTGFAHSIGVIIG